VAKDFSVTHFIQISC